MIYALLSVAARQGLTQMPLPKEDYERLVRGFDFSRRLAADLEMYWFRLEEIRALKFRRGKKFKTLKNELKKRMTNILKQLQDEHR